MGVEWPLVPDSLSCGSTALLSQRLGVADSAVFVRAYLIGQLLDGSISSEAESVRLSLYTIYIYRVVVWVILM